MKSKFSQFEEAQFVDDQENARRACIGEQKVQIMYLMLQKIHEDTKHLSKLPELVDSISSNVQVLADIRDRLVDKATSQDSRLTKVFLVALVSIALVMLLTTIFLTRLQMNISPSNGIQIQGAR